MKKLVKHLFLTFFIVIIAVACDPENVIEHETVKGKTETASDYVWDDSNVKTITLNGTSISSSSTDVTINGTTATITAAGYYLIKGSLTNGQLVINAPKAKMKIMLDGVTISNSTSSPFNILDATKVILFLKSGTINTFTDAFTYTNPEELKSVISSEAYLGITGEGTLNINGNFNDGISCDDPVVINSGTINVNAIDDAIRSKDYVLVHNGNITATSITGHALKADSTVSVGKGYVKIDGGNFTLSSALGDGIHTYKRAIIENGTFAINAEESQAIKSDSSVLISGGTINVTATKTGIESPFIAITGGTTSLTTTKTAISASYGNAPTVADSSTLSISGGKLYINALSHAIFSNGNIGISGGTTVVQGPSSSSKLMVNYLGEFAITNGLFIGAGPNAGSLIKGFSTTSTQNSVKISSSFIGTNLINIQDASGNSVATFKPLRTAYYLVFSSPSLATGTTYSIYTGGSYSGGTIVNGYYSGGTYTPGTQKATFTPAMKVTSVSF